MDDVPLQLETLAKGLKDHFDTVEVKKDLPTEQLRDQITRFLRTYGNDSNARLFIYYAGHGYTEVIRQRNEARGYITGVDTPRIDFTPQAFDAARLRAISMPEIRGILDDVLAKHVLFVFDSCFAGTIFTSRGENDAPPPLAPEWLKDSWRGRPEISSRRVDRMNGSRRIAQSQPYFWRHLTAPRTRISMALCRHFKFISICWIGCRESGTSL